LWNLQADRKELTSDASKSESALDSDKAKKEAEGKGLGIRVLKLLLWRS
jgi:hypothetical protein